MSEIQLDLLPKSDTVSRSEHEALLVAFNKKWDEFLTVIKERDRYRATLEHLRRQLNNGDVIPPNGSNHRLITATLLVKS